MGLRERLLDYIAYKGIDKATLGKKKRTIKRRC